MGVVSDTIIKRNASRRKKDKLEKTYGFPMSKNLEDVVATMCNLSDVIEEKGLEKGKETTLYDLIQSGLITPEVGAKKLSV